MFIKINDKNYNVNSILSITPDTSENDKQIIIDELEKEISKFEKSEYLEKRRVVYREVLWEVHFKHGKILNLDSIISKIERTHGKYEIEFINGNKIKGIISEYDYERCLKWC